MVVEFKLELERRSELGKQAVKRLRKEDKIPGVYYSSGGNSIPFYIDKKHLHQAFQSEARVYAVSVGGKKYHAIFKEIQYHPVTDEILHIDLYGISLKDKISITVPIVLEGEADGVKNYGGVLSHSATELEIRCLATEVPDAIHIDITNIGVGESIHAGDLDLGKFELVSSPDTTIVSVHAPRVVVEIPVIEEEEVVEAEAEEVEEAKTPPKKGEEEAKTEESDTES